MPVILNTNIMHTLQKIGVNPALLAKLSADNWKLTMAPDGVKFSGMHPKVPGQSVEHLVSIKSTKLMAAAKGVLTQVEVKHYRDALNAAIQDVIAGNFDTVSEGPQTIAEPPPQPKSDPFKTTEPVAKEPITGLGAYQMMAPFLAKHQPVTPQQMQVADPLPLVDAFGLYAPVRGTDKSSKYFLLAVFSHFKVAGRLKGNKLSVRVEGTIPNTVTNALMGIKFIPSEKHISTHVMVSDTVEANRYMGCVLGSIVSAGENLMTPMPNLSHIAGKGI